MDGRTLACPQPRVSERYTPERDDRPARASLRTPRLSPESVNPIGAFSNWQGFRHPRAQSLLGSSHHQMWMHRAHVRNSSRLPVGRLGFRGHNSGRARGKKSGNNRTVSASTLGPGCTDGVVAPGFPTTRFIARLPAFGRETWPEGCALALRSGHRQ